MGHVHGGETAPGIWDEQIRHAITKMAHVHFCATDAAARRILQMGESPESVHVVGAPALDMAKGLAEGHQQNLASGEMGPQVLRNGYPILLLHPSSADVALEKRRALQVLRAIRRVFPKSPFSVIGPNNDPGHRGILQAYTQEKQRLSLSMSLQQAWFWGGSDDGRTTHRKLL